MWVAIATISSHPLAGFSICLHFCFRERREGEEGERRPPREPREPRPEGEEGQQQPRYRWNADNFFFNFMKLNCGMMTHDVCDHV